MTMEKYSIDDNALTLELQNEEGQLMARVAQMLGDPLRADDVELSRCNSRIADLRCKIDELRAKKNQTEVG